MSFQLTKEQIHIYEDSVSISAQLNDVVNARDEEASFKRHTWQTAGTQILQGLAISKEYGGKGLDPFSTIISLQGIGYGCKDNGLNFAIGAHLLSVAIPISLFGTKNQKSQFLPQLCNGEWIGANAITEKEHGSDVFNMQTIGIKKENNYHLNGQKDYCSNGTVSDIVLIYANTNKSKGFFGGISAFILERNKSHFTTSGKKNKIGLNSCEMSSIILDEVSVPQENMLGKEGAGSTIFLKSMDWERIGLSAIHLGTFERILDKAKIFVKKRKIFGSSIGNYQAISHKLVELSVELEAAKLLLYKSAWLLNENKQVDLLGSMVKLKASELYKNGMIDLLQIFGGAGYVENSEIGNAVKDSLGSTLYSGSSEIQKNLIAKKLKIN